MPTHRKIGASFDIATPKSIVVGPLIVGLPELFLLTPDSMITIRAGLEVDVEISAFGVGGEEGSVLLSGHIRSIDRPLHFV